MPVHHTPLSFGFQPLARRDVTADFAGGQISSEAGALLLRELEASTHIIQRFASCFIDHRDKESIEFSVEQLLAQRIYSLILGYEDLNDHDTLRFDPLLATLVGRVDPTGSDRLLPRDKGKPLAGKSTLNRLELTPVGASSHSRYKKIVYIPHQQDELLVQLFVETTEEPEEIILDLDTTNDTIHGNQEGRFFQGYYDEYCYLPLYIFCGHDLLVARLLTADSDPAKAALAELPVLIKRIRRYWPNVRIIVRGDSAFSTDPLMRACEESNVDYIFGLAGNSRLQKELEPFLDEAKKLVEQLPTPKAQRCFHDFPYQTLKSWSCTRRVVGKAEYLPDGPNPRFVVTSLPDTLWDARSVYEDLYCARGEMENRIKEQQMGLFADRTSTKTLRANQLRLMLSSVAYVMLHLLRKLALKNTELARAQVWTIRSRLLKIGALVTVSVRRVFIQMSSAYPYQDLFRRVYDTLRSRIQPAS